VRIFLYYIGRPRDRHANAIAEEFLKRCRRWTTVEMREVDVRRPEPWSKLPGATRIALDPGGRLLDSAEFLSLIRQAEMEGRDLVFLIGGAEGLPEAWREAANLVLSLTPLTLAHELARVILAEQIYRALATLRGHPYPR
jgi:23S rRNA (pseudouridine1915-N3)-methyltransferase